jgi:hypothetical protein
MMELPPAPVNNEGMNTYGQIRRGGAAAGVAILSLLIVVAIILWLMFGRGGDGEQSYVENVVESRDIARESVNRTEFVNLARWLQQYAMMENHYPASTDEMIRNNAARASWFRAEDDQPQPVVYIPGQTPRSPQDNVLVYENYEGLDRSADVQVIRVGGQVETLPAEQAAEAVEQTRTNLD